MLDNLEVQNQAQLWEVITLQQVKTLTLNQLVLLVIKTLLINYRQLLEYKL